MRKKITPKIGDRVFGVTEYGKIVPTLVCGLYSQTYEGGETSQYSNSACRPIFPSGASSLNIETMAQIEHAFFDFEEAAGFARRVIKNAMRENVRINTYKQLFGRLTALRTRYDEMKHRAEKQRHSFHFDRSAYANFYEAEDESCMVPTAEMQFDHLPIDSEAYVVDTNSWVLKHGTITGVYFWPRHGFCYRFGIYNWFRADRVFKNKKTALRGMSALFAQSNPGKLSPSQVKVVPVGSAATQQEEEHDFTLAFMSKALT